MVLFRSTGTYLGVKEYALFKILDRSKREEPGKDWQKTRLAPAISWFKTNVSKTKECIQQCLTSNDTLAYICSILHGIPFTSGTTIKLDSQPMYQCLKGLNKDDIERLNVNPADFSQFLEQRSEPWLELRHEAKATGTVL